MRFGEKLSFLRKQRGMTQIELAEKLDVSRQAVSRWEQGTSKPSTENLVSTVLLAKESGVWKVFAFSAASEDIIQDAYGNDRSAENFDVNRMIEIVSEHQNSIWKNVSGDVIEDNRATRD